MITELKICNFKSHAHSQFEMKPLTIFTGLNSSGKSSVLQSLLVLRQSAKNNRLPQGLDLNNPLVFLGNGNDVLYKLATNGEIAIDISTENDAYHFAFDAEHSLTDSFLSKKSYSESTNSPSINALSLFNNDFQYVSSLRWGGKTSFLKDTYLVEKERQISQRFGQCELVGHFLHYWGSELCYDYLKNDGSEDTLLSQVIKWEQLISPNLTIKVEKTPDDIGYTVLYGYEGLENTKPINNLRAENIGFGVSYTLPVLVAVLSAAPGALLLIENPEAHLHPAGQSYLAKIMALAAQRGVQIIIETHSDHIINGVLVASKLFDEGEKGINRDNVAMYYLTRNEENHTTQSEKITIEQLGRIDYQPIGFFDQIEHDIALLNSWK